MEYQNTDKISQFLISKMEQLGITNKEDSDEYRELKTLVEERMAQIELIILNQQTEGTLSANECKEKKCHYAGTINMCIEQEGKEKSCDGCGFYY